MTLTQCTSQYCPFPQHKRLPVELGAVYVLLQSTGGPFCIELACCSYLELIAHYLVALDKVAHIFTEKRLLLGSKEIPLFLPVKQFNVRTGVEKEFFLSSLLARNQRVYK